MENAQTENSAAGEASVLTDVLERSVIKHSEAHSSPSFFSRSREYST